MIRRKPKVYREKQTLENVIVIDKPCGKLSKVISHLTELREQLAGEGWTNIQLVEEWENSEDNYFLLIMTRLETDDEYRSRIEGEEAELRKWLLEREMQPLP